MTSPPSPPDRRRRRIVVTMAVLLLGLSWWFWPRVDQRFVGTWGFPAYDGNGLSPPMPEIRHFVLDANGFGKSESLASRRGTFQWWVRETGDATVLIMQFPSKRNAAVVWYEYVLAVFTGAGYPREFEAWDATLTGTSLTICAGGRSNRCLGLIRLK